MKKYIITISREFGCGARSIARQLASDLGVHLYDKDLVDMAARKAGVNQDLIRDNDEVIQKKSVGNLFREFGYGSTTNFFSENAINAQADVIRDIANQKESCIIFGRCADYFLREYPNMMDFFLYAPLEYRIAHISESYELDPLQAEKLIRRVDRQRHNYYKYVTGKNRGDRYDKHLMLDVAKFRDEGTVTLMKEAILQVFDK